MPLVERVDENEVVNVGVGMRQGDAIEHFTQGRALRRRAVGGVDQIAGRRGVARTNRRVVVSGGDAGDEVDADVFRVEIDEIVDVFETVQAGDVRRTAAEGLAVDVERRHRGPRGQCCRRSDRR